MILGIETSCDDSAVSIVENGKKVISNVSIHQDDYHKKFKGVVPEIASRRHTQNLLPAIFEALNLAKISLKDVSRHLKAIAVTNRPGLVGSLMVGVTTAKTLGYAWNLPVININHLAAHVYSLQLSTTLNYPFLSFIVSGGHTLLTLVKDYDNIDVIGSTLDDACGECFDKVAKHFDLGYPGGQVIDRLAQKGNPNKISYPITHFKDEKRFCVSYSGLKTAVLYQTKDLFKKYSKSNVEPNISDICASFQKAAFEPLIRIMIEASYHYDIKTIGICGGVSANSYLRELMKRTQSKHSINFVFPEMKYCTDNGAMVAGLGYQFFKDKKYNSFNYSIKSDSKSVRPILKNKNNHLNRLFSLT